MKFKLVEAQSKEKREANRKLKQLFNIDGSATVHHMADKQTDDVSQKITSVGTYPVAIVKNKISQPNGRDFYHQLLNYIQVAHIHSLAELMSELESIDILLIEDSGKVNQNNNPILVSNNINIGDYITYVDKHGLYK